MVVSYQEDDWPPDQVENSDLKHFWLYFSSQEDIAYFLTQEAVHLLVHFKFLRV